jgi:hypothetical protein
MLKQSMKNTKNYATMQSPVIQAIANEMYRLESAMEAGFRVVRLSQQYIVAKKQIPNKDYPSVILWIKGFALREQDAKQGVIGHFALITYKKIGERYTLFATKMDVPAKEHPQRALVIRGNPNWSHPVLRAVRKGKRYPTAEAAQAELALLHEHYPNVTIPTPGALYMMIYCADRPARERMVKHILTIHPDEAKGGYAIDIKENPRKSRPALRHETPPAGAPKGKFTAKVAFTRARKGKKT